LRVFWRRQRAPTTFAFDDVPFAQRLAEAIAWAEPRAVLDDARRALRSDDLRPPGLPRARAAMVTDALRLRASALRAAPPPASTHADLHGGRLLVYFPECSLCDGAAEAASHGFFDAENTPPWDLWVALGAAPHARNVNHRVYLSAWIPEMLLDIANSGIDMNAEECICWLEDAPIAARDELRAYLR
jgi:hypothetical protein